MGEVYRARDTRLDRQVAIKVLRSDSITDPHFRERFDRETRAVAALSHPNIVAIYDVGTHEGARYAASELLEGDTLGSRIGGLPLPLRTALDYAVQIARGPAAAHARGLVHRDLKPDSIFVTPDNQVKILDFGLAMQVAVESSDQTTRLAQTERGAVLGTVGYMSPEQARGERADERSDVGFERGRNQGRWRLAVSANADCHGPRHTWQRAGRSGLARARLPGRVEGSAHRPDGPHVGVTPA
jgi:serine/threonine protein kinase